MEKGKNSCEYCPNTKEFTLSARNGAEETWSFECLLCAEHKVRGVQDMLQDYKPTFVWELLKEGSNHASN